jgi:hypothetical protein
MASGIAHVVILAPCGVTVFGLFALRSLNSTGSIPSLSASSSMLLSTANVIWEFPALLIAAVLGLFV